MRWQAPSLAAGRARLVGLRPPLTDVLVAAGVLVIAQVETWMTTGTSGLTTPAWAIWRGGIEPVPVEDETTGIAGASRLVPDWPGRPGRQQRKDAG